VLVNVVYFVESPNGVIPSNIWLYDINDEIADVVASDLYFSTVDCSYKFLLRIPYGEVAMLGRSATSDSDNFTSHEVERGSHIMNGITEYQRNAFRQRLCIEYQCISTCKISIDANTARASS